MLVPCIHLYTTPTWVETSCKGRKFRMRNRAKEEWRRQRSWFPLDKMSEIIRERARQQETFLLSFVLHSVRSPSWGQIMISFPQRIGDLLDDPFLTHQSPSSPPLPSPPLPVRVRAPKLWARFIPPRGDNSSGRRKHNFGSHHLKPCALLSNIWQRVCKGSKVKWITWWWWSCKEVRLGVDDLLEGWHRWLQFWDPFFCVLYVSFYMLPIDTWQQTLTRMMMFRFLQSNLSAT